MVLLDRLAKSPCGDQPQLRPISNQSSLWWLLFSRRKVSDLICTLILKPLAKRAAGLAEEAHGMSKVTHNNLARKQYFVGRLSVLGV